TSRTVYCSSSICTTRPPLRSTLFPYTTLFRSYAKANRLVSGQAWELIPRHRYLGNAVLSLLTKIASGYWHVADSQSATCQNPDRSEEHTSELQSRGHLVCRLLLEKKKYITITK